MLFRLSILATLACFSISGIAAAQSIKFGDDSGGYPNDDECDDRRFYGPGVVSGELNWESLGKDASDCRTAVEAGRATLWVLDDARAATSCGALRWGDDSSEYSNDGVCDDPRFEGVGAASILIQDDSGRDATDCRRLCEFGLIFLRDY